MDDVDLVLQLVDRCPGIATFLPSSPNSEPSSTIA
jgi:hypothetical protein